MTVLKKDNDASKRLSTLALNFPYQIIQYKKYNTYYILLEIPNICNLHCVAQVTSRQFIGDPIDCMSDSMSSGIMDIYCWIHSTYSVNGK